jgi:hypothetical protein
MARQHAWLPDVIIDGAGGSVGSNPVKRGMRERGADDVDREREGRREGGAQERGVERTVGIVVHAGATLNRRLAIAANIPRKTDARAKILQRRVFKDRSHGEVDVGDGISQG